MIVIPCTDVYDVNGWGLIQDPRIPSGGRVRIILPKSMFVTSIPNNSIIVCVIVTWWSGGILGNGRWTLYDVMHSP